MSETVERVGIELCDCENVLLREIADTRMKREDVAQTYAMTLRSSERDDVDWSKVNHAIMDRWSAPSHVLAELLNAIEARGWKLVPASQLDQAERRAEEAKADAAEANYQANMMSRNLQAANALAASYRQGLERFIERVDTLDTEDPDYETFSDHLLDELDTLRSLLNPSSSREEAGS